MPFENFPERFASLPTISYVVPNQQHNMHSGSINAADEWYQSNIAPYAAWAMKHNSLLVVTWDESHQTGDQIPILFYGPMVKPAHYSRPITQDNVLRTLEDMYGLAPTGNAANATPLTSIFKTQSSSPRTPIATTPAASRATLHGKSPIAAVPKSHKSLFSNTKIE